MTKVFKELNEKVMVNKYENTENTNEKFLEVKIFTLFDKLRLIIYNNDRK